MFSSYDGYLPGRVGNGHLNGDVLDASAGHNGTLVNGSWNLEGALPNNTELWVCYDYATPL